MVLFIGPKINVLGLFRSKRKSAISSIAYRVNRMRHFVLVRVILVTVTQGGHEHADTMVARRQASDLSPHMQ